MSQIQSPCAGTETQRTEDRTAGCSASQIQSPCAGTETGSTAACHADIARVADTKPLRWH